MFSILTDLIENQDDLVSVKMTYTALQILNQLLVSHSLSEKQLEQMLARLPIVMTLVGNSNKRVRRHSLNLIASLLSDDRGKGRVASIVSSGFFIEITHIFDNATRYLSKKRSMFSARAMTLSKIALSNAENPRAPVLTEIYESRLKDIDTALKIVQLLCRDSIGVRKMLRSRESNFRSFDLVTSCLALARAFDLFITQKEKLNAETNTDNENLCDPVAVLSQILFTIRDIVRHSPVISKPPLLSFH